MNKLVNWFKQLFRRIFKRKEEEEKKAAQIKKLEIESFKKLTDFFRKIVPKTRPMKAPTTKLKKRGRGYTKSPYNFAKVKRRRKIAEESRRRNRA